jgi:hypothetical protein
MITPKEIQQQCLNWWKTVFQAHIESVDFFPKEINRIGKITAKNLLEKLPEYQKSVALLRNDAKPNKKQGYVLVEKEQQFEKIGRHPVPEKIVIESLEDYLKLTGKEKEYQQFLKNYSLLIQELPALKKWSFAHPQKLIEHNTWTDILKVCNYFIENPAPHLYIRELPIAVHSKFIENNKGIIRELLDILLGENVNMEETEFEKRFHLRYADPLVRFRILDKQISEAYFSGIDDISIPISQFEQLKIPVNRVLIVENKTNLHTIALTLPKINRTLVVFGSGYKVEILKNSTWFRQTALFYWGDIDAQGFEILSQFRGYFPHTQSILMDSPTFDRYFENDDGTPSKISVLQNLTDAERQLYERLKTNNWRLEQEKIPVSYVNDWIKNHLDK